ncbi:MAG: PRD domain-containing protein [Lachnospiraceae bacterium]
MYQITKVLNHNAVLAVSDRSRKERLIMGKGVGFGRKKDDQIEKQKDWNSYALTKEQMDSTEGASEMVEAIDPVYFEISDRILDRASEEFGPIDRSVLFPLAEHMAYATKRIKNGEEIQNPLTQDIRLLLYKEFKVASVAAELLQKAKQVTISEDEIGFIALHVHSAIENGTDTKVMEIARTVRTCITLIEQDTNRQIDTLTVSYNLLMNHIKYMVARALNHEDLKFDMNHFIQQNMPKAFQTAKTVWEYLEKQLGMPLHENEIGYLAIHIARVYEQDETGTNKKEKIEKGE